MGREVRVPRFHLWHHPGEEMWQEGVGLQWPCRGGGWEVTTGIVGVREGTPSHCSQGAMGVSQTQRARLFRSRLPREVSGEEGGF